ncbi:MAG: hypothetical protein CM15mP102_14200 [Flavobacteriales bacterium]|nr:MAG: hypothetical protein CM15mP102_14200 [Flavobacteriales bacterium]
MKSQILSILFFFGCITMAAQSGTITGSVTDSSNNDLLPGVNVLVKTQLMELIPTLMEIFHLKCFKW